MRNTITHGDCLEVMPTLPAASVDMILADLPYGTTRNKWDSVIPLEPLWAEYRRVVKPAGAIVLTAQMPFTAVLALSNRAWLRYEWIWQKERGTGYLNSGRMPLKDHENILVFSQRSPRYYPQLTPGRPYRHVAQGQSSNYGRRGRVICLNEGTRQPTTVLYVPRDRPVVHPTQKPVALFEYLIRTYTLPGDVVLDNVAGSGTTAVACLNTGRDYICIEKDPHYVDVARKRVQECVARLEASSGTVLR